MWYVDLPEGASWSALWSDYWLCGCSAIRRKAHPCPVCGDEEHDNEPPMLMRLEDGRKVSVYAAVPGAEGRYEDYIYLQMLQREWERPAPEFERFAQMPMATRPSARAALVLLFWGYFETRIERLMRSGMKSLPPAVQNNLLERYSSIGSRIDRLYKISFGTTYHHDLNDLGYGEVGQFLTELQRRRNEFVHGQPQAIDDATVGSLVKILRLEHESWIAVFNKRTTGNRKHIGT